MAFIVVEGIDGSGKTTIINKLKEKLPAYAKRELVFVRNPMNSDYFSSAFKNYHAVRCRYEGCTELQRSLFLADLMYTNTEIIKPALERNATVIADRWYHSFFVYQYFYPVLRNYAFNPNSTPATYHEIINQNVDWKELEPVIFFLNRELARPSLVVFLETDPQEAKKRLKSRPNQSTDDLEEANLIRLEMLDKGYQFLKNGCSSYISYSLEKIKPYAHEDFNRILSYSAFMSGASLEVSHKIATSESF